MNLSQQFKSGLDRLENTLLTPIVPGELEGWMAGLSESAELVGTLLWRQIETVHNPEYDEIVRRDPDLFPQVKQLRQGDKESLARLEALLDRFAKLKQNAPRFEPDEAATKARLDS